MNFKEILDLESARSIAFLLNGLESNLLLFVLEGVLDKQSQVELPEGCDAILQEVAGKLKRQLRGHQFMDWRAFKEITAERPIPVMSPDEMKEAIEKIYNGGASSLLSDDEERLQ